MAVGMFPGVLKCAPSDTDRGAKEAGNARQVGWSRARGQILEQGQEYGVVVAFDVGY